MDNKKTELIRFRCTENLRNAVLLGCQRTGRRNKMIRNKTYRNFIIIKNRLMKEKGYSPKEYEH